MAIAGHIAGFCGGAGATEAIKIQRPADLDLKAFEAISRLQAGIQGLLHHKAVMPNVRDRNQPVRQPAKLEAGAWLKTALTFRMH